ncbi:MAG: gliding motility-associated C-terminal domain-containing protein [Saprospiraceae bacterium]|nr:gliding motility-associated C-terminal domain-containing protein [Saprospiraceae bacterium]
MKSMFNKTKIKISLICLGFLILFLIPYEVAATHIVGGNITYKHISGNVYQVKLVLRRDCFLGSPEAQFDSLASVGIFSYGGTLQTDFGNNGQLKLLFMSSDTLNEYVESDCGFEGTQVCVHQTTYMGLFTLTDKEDLVGGYILAYQRCCRNISLNNIVDPDGTGATYWTTISKESLAFKNSSPEFNQWPDVYICANKPLSFNHAATDRNGDSLVYKLCVPSSGATRIDPKPQPPLPPLNTNVIWASPHSLNDMMGGIPLKIDSKTGLITATPNLQGQFLIGVCVEEYRNGKLIGLVRRDFQFNVRPCSQPPKAIFTTSETNCDGLTVSFFNESLSAGNFEWDFNYPSTNPIFKSTEKNPVFTFPSSGVYTVRLRATRVSDACFDTILQKVSVFENKIQPDFKYALSGCNNVKDSLKILLTDLSIFDQPGYAINKWEWLITQNGVSKTYFGKVPTIDVSYTGNVEVKLSLEASNGCKSTFSKTIVIAEVIPEGDFNFVYSGCPTSGIVELVYTNVSGPLNPFGVIESSNWIIAGQSFSGSPLTVTLPQNVGTIKTTLETVFIGGCSISSEKSIDLNALIPQADYSYKPITCPTDSTVQLSFGYIDTLSNNILTSSILWSAGTETNRLSFTGSNIDFIIPKDSIVFFDLTVNFANGCSDTIKNSFLPGPFAKISFLADPIILCPNQEKTFVTNPNPDWTYTWSPSTGLDLTDPSNPKVSVSQNTTYNVTVSDGLCSVVSSADIIALEGGIVLTVSGDTTTCDGKVTLNVDGGIGTGVYNWGTDVNVTNIVGTGESIDVNFVGNVQTYYVEFVGESCSTIPASITVKNQTPKIDLILPNKICKNDTFRLITLNLVPAHMNTYLWESDPHILNGANTPAPQIFVGPNESLPFYLFYNVTNQFGCTIRDSALFNIGINPTVDFNFNLTECGKYEVCFNVIGNFDGFIRWNFGDLTTTDDKSIEKTPCYVYPGGGTYLVNLENLVGECPFKDLNKSITINPQITLTPIADQLLCFGDTLRLNAASNLANVEYSWFDADGNLLVSDKKYETILIKDDFFIIKAEDNYNCVVFDTVYAKIFKFVYDITIADSLCINEESKIFLNIADPDKYQFLWTPAECIKSGANTSTPIIIGLPGKSLNVLLTHKDTGCKQTGNITPKVTQPFSFEITGEDKLCNAQPSKIMLEISNPERYLYLWSPAECFQSGVNTSNPTINIKANKTISVLVTNKMSGCKEEKSFLATVGEEVSINVDAQPDFTIYEGDTLDLFISDIISEASYSWSTSETGTTITVRPNETTSFTVTVTDENGCTAIDEVIVTVRKARCDETDVYLPNAFSPNGDANNPVLYVRSNFIDDMELIIYNRWGQEVFRSKDQSVGWDGTFKGQELSPDAFAYYLRVKCVNSVEYIKKGNVNLIR